MSDVKSLETSRANVEMIEKPDQIVTPDSELNHDIEGADAEERTTAKAWLCVFLLSLSFGLPFWATPTTAAISAQLLGQFGSSALSAWVIPCITTAAAVTILLFTANSDLFGRRWFMLAANIVTGVGYIVCARANSHMMLIAGLSLNGCGSGMAGIALIAVPELIPNKWRHIGVVLADGFVYIMIVIGPVVGRFAIRGGGEDWRWLYWAGFIGEAICTIGMVVFYHPPKHPRGISVGDALRGLDWMGGALFSVGCVLVLVGMVYTSYIPSTDPRVLVTLCLGFAFIIAFGLWERFSNVRFPLCPHSIFVSNYGREFTAPFCLTFILVGFFYGSAVVYPTTINAFYIDENTSVSEELLLTLPNTVGILVGATLLSVFGNKIGHWRWQLVISTTSLVLWGSLFATVTPYNKPQILAFAVLTQVSYGWSVYLSVAYTQLGVPQEMLGISGGLAGTARYAGGAVAAASFSTAISNGIAKRVPQLVPKAALEAGLPQSSVDAVLAAVGQGAAALKPIPGVNDRVLEAVADAYKWSVAFGLRNAALASMAFGVVGILLAFYCEDITPKMNNKIEVFLENDALAEKNKHH